jgi:DNA repair exonuclease SbcCD ATPase subunit
MREIALVSVELEGFKSFKEKTIVTLSQTQGFKFLGGENKAEPRLGANGAGKSTLWDAIIWCLYGTSAKGLRAAELASWGETTISVLIHWNIDGSEVATLRMGNPNRVYIDGRAAEQCELDAIFMSRTRFLQSVIFGQKVNLFPDLDMGSRAALLDDVLNLGVWLQKAKRAGDICTGLEAKLTQLDQELARAEGMINGIKLEDLDKLCQDEAQWIAKRREHIDLCGRAVDAAEIAVNNAKAKLGFIGDALALEKEWAGYTLNIEDRRKTLGKYTLDLRTITDKADDCARKLAFYTKHADCPTCAQAMSIAMRKAAMKKINSELNELDEDEEAVQRMRKAIMDDIKELQHLADNVQTKLNASQLQRNDAKTKLALAQQDLKAKHLALDQSTEEQRNPYSNRIHMLETALKREKGMFNKTKKLRAALAAELALSDYWRVGFKRIRLYRITSVLAYLELETSNAAQALGLNGWKIEFATETETKTGSTKYGVQIIVTSPKAKATWEAWSGGENQRLRLAIALGLAALIQSMSGVAYKFEVWDEPSAWLSEQGIGDLLDALHARARSLDASIWLCDHRSFDRGRFDEVWQVTKKRSGSKVARLA